MYKSPLKFVFNYKYLSLIQIGFRPCIVYLVTVLTTIITTTTTTTTLFYVYNNFNYNLYSWRHNKCILILNYLSPYVLKKFWC